MAGMRPRRAGQGLLGAVAFLTIVPVPARLFGEAEFDLGPALAWFPLVGAAVGACAGGLRVALDRPLGSGPSTVIAISALVVLTGALHQDGLADTADGLGARGDRARRLAVMRDSAIGAFGVLALILWALLLFTALAHLGADRALPALLAAGAIGRLAALLHAAFAPPARGDGLGAGMRVTSARVAWAVALAAGVAVAAVGPARAGLSLGVGALFSALTAGGARRAVGGSTGDTLGAAVAVTEVAVCLALVATWP
jgi:adenosylcobinamide-GDP ribazoletransferase